MARGPKAKLDQTKRVEVWIPTSVLAKVKLELFSDVESKIPFGTMSSLATELFTNWLKSRGIQ